jgi:hypothetical protein
MFTETEKTILNALPKEYKYIYRFKDRALYIGKTSNTQDYHASFCMFGHLFKDVKAGAKPICFREPVLNDTERRYLKAALKPFHQDIECVKKIKYRGDQFEFIEVMMNDHEIGMVFPNFETAKMYTGMKPNEAYTLDELGITYD